MSNRDYTTEIVDLRTDPRAESLWSNELVRWNCEYAADFLEHFEQYHRDMEWLAANPVKPADRVKTHPLRDSLMAKHQHLRGGCSVGSSICSTEAYFKTFDDIMTNGYKPDSPIKVRLTTDDQFKFLDGTHRSCILLVLGLPIIAELQILKTQYEHNRFKFNPLKKYPLKDDHNGILHNPPVIDRLSPDRLSPESAGSGQTGNELPVSGVDSD